MDADTHDMKTVKFNQNIDNKNSIKLYYTNDKSNEWYYIVNKDLITKEELDLASDTTWK